MLTAGGMAMDGFSARIAAKRVSGHVTYRTAATPEGPTVFLAAFLGPCVQFLKLHAP